VESWGEEARVGQGTAAVGMRRQCPPTTMEQPGEVMRQQATSARPPAAASNLPREPDPTERIDFDFVVRHFLH
jgi:hypothetical protein